MQGTTRAVLLCVATALLAACGSAQQKPPRACDSGYVRLNSVEYYVTQAGKNSPVQEQQHDKPTH